MSSIRFDAKVRSELWHHAMQSWSAWFFARMGQKEWSRDKNTINVKTRAYLKKFLLIEVIWQWLLRQSWPSNTAKKRFRTFLCAWKQCKSYSYRLHRAAVRNLPAAPDTYTSFCFAFAAVFFNGAFECVYCCHLKEAANSRNTARLTSLKRANNAQTEKENKFF